MENGKIYIIIFKGIMFSIKLLGILLLFVLSTSYTYTYPQCGQQKLYIYSGIVQLTSNYGGERRQCYPFSINQEIPHGRQVAAIASPSDFSGYNSQDGIDYLIKIKQKEKSSKFFTLVALLDTESRWTVSVSYIIFLRQEFYAGSFLGDTFAFLECSRDQNSKTLVKSEVQEWKKSRRNIDIEIIVFVSGLRTSTPNFSLKLGKGELNQYDGILQVGVFTNAVIQTVQISYIIYKRNVPLQILIVDYDHLRDISNSTVHLVGMSELKQSVVIFLGFGISSQSNKIVCKGSGCPSTCIDPTVCQKYRENYRGFFYQDICVICSRGQVYRNGQCTPSCGAYEVFINGRCQCESGYDRYRGVCQKKCAPYAVRNLNGVCTCVSGYVFQNNRCVPQKPEKKCRKNEYFASGQCLCIPGCFRNNLQICVPVPRCGTNELFQDYKCVCKPGFKRDYTNKCVPQKKCNYDQDLINGQCICKDGYRREYTGRCIQVKKCGQNQFLQATGQCLCKKGFIRGADEICRQQCEQYGYYWLGDCECIPGYYRPSAYTKCEKLIECGHYQVVKDKECVCIEGFKRVNGYCIKIICGENQIVQGQQCVCKPWHVRRNGVCVYEKSCPQNEVLQGTECVCKPWYIRYNGVCIYENTKCGQHQNYINGRCVCEYGYTKRNGKCIVIHQECGQNQIRTYYGCICQLGYTKIQGKCIRCPQYSKLVNGQCKCQAGYYYQPNHNICIPVSHCPDYSSYVQTPTGYKCLCYDGYYYKDSKCILCYPNSHSSPDRKTCICDQGYFYEEQWKKCMKIGDIPQCPANSVWNSQQLRCQCVVANQYLIDGVCRPCGTNQKWDKTQCVCISGYHRVQGICVVCDSHSYYNGSECVCNHGFYKHLDECEQCYPTCGQCTGPQYNHCTSCLDVTYALSNGQCEKQDCPKGLFKNIDGLCQKCSSYCNECQSQEYCNECINGFELQIISIIPQKISYCKEVCGDGKRFQLDCDDGNTDNNDGCSSDCQIQSGWTCTGGSSVQKSICKYYQPSRSFIKPTGAVHLYGRVVQGVRLTHVPSQIIANDCPQCFKLLWVKVIKADIVPAVKVSYVPKSKYQFYIQFEFHGLFSIPVYEFTIQLNPEFSDYFSEADLHQVQKVDLDPSLLSRMDVEDKLLIKDQNTVVVPASAKSIIQGNQ